MRYFRSFMFDIYFYIISFLISFFFLPLLLGPINWGYLAPKAWGFMTLWGAKWILGLDYKVEGWENLPPAPYIIASKHQSAWETAAMTYIFPGSVFILKKELKYVPLFNLYFWRLKAISVDRSLGKLAIEPMLKEAEAHTKEGRCIIIYPEGTRSAVGQAGRYKFGVAALYEGLSIPVVPVALNSGVFWPRRSFLKYAGTITVTILPAIESGINKTVFMKTLQDMIEKRTNALCQRREV